MQKYFCGIKIWVKINLNECNETIYKINDRNNMKLFKVGNVYQLWYRWRSKSCPNQKSLLKIAKAKS